MKAWLARLFSRPKPPRLPGSLSIVGGDCMLDGGTVLLTGIDDEGARRHLRLDQALTTPGWLHFDNWRVPYRSEAEVRLLSLLKDCLAARPPLPEIAPPKAGESVGTPGGGSRMFGSDDLAAYFTHTRNDALTWLIIETIRRVEDTDYITPPGITSTRF